MKKELEKILSKMEDIMPFRLPDEIEPYVREAMEHSYQLGKDEDSWKCAKTTWPDKPCTCLCKFLKGYYKIVYFNKMSWYCEDKTEITHYQIINPPKP